MPCRITRKNKYVYSIKGYQGNSPQNKQQPYMCALNITVLVKLRRRFIFT